MNEKRNGIHERPLSFVYWDDLSTFQELRNKEFMHEIFKLCLLKSLKLKLQ